MHALAHRELDEATDALLVASRVLVGVAARSLPEGEDVTLQQFRALVVLSSEETVTASHLAAALGIHQSSATRLCDRLARKGLIARVPRETDRRAIVVNLTAAGRRLVRRVSGRRRREIRTIASHMSSNARRQALAGLSAFAEAAGEPPSDVDRFGWSGP